jgi:hypothetical protein
MTTRKPPPRTSSLAGSTPVTPPAPVVARAAASAPTVANVAPGKRPKVSFYQDEADTDRMRGAYLATQHLTGYTSLSDFIDRTMMEKVAALEAKYNNGEEYPPIVADRRRAGRPLGT